MNYASVVFAGFSAIAALWYAINARKHYKGPAVSALRRSVSRASYSSAPPAATLSA